MVLWGPGPLLPPAADWAALRLWGVFMHRFLKFLRGEDGPTAVEYAVMLALIVGAALVGITSFGQATLTSFQDSSTKINTAVGS